MNELALFSGAGGGLLASKLLGWNTVCAVEIDPYCREVLLTRQREGHLERFPIWDDIKTFDGKAWHGKIGVISGGFPCQDISVAGKHRGLAGVHSGLWTEFARIIGEVRPPYVFIENSPNIRVNGLVRVLQDLTKMGFMSRWAVLGGDALGAPQVRKRFWLVAQSQGIGCGSGWQRGPSASLARKSQQTFQKAFSQKEWPTLGRIQRVVDGLAHRVDRVKATGNGQIPQVAALAWKVLT